MPAVRWYYARKNCVTCQKASEFLLRRKVTPKETVNGLKVKFAPDEALAIAAGVQWVVVVGRGVVVTHSVAASTRDDLLAAMLGRSGTLRAPAALIGRKLVIGFSPGLYEELLG